MHPNELIELYPSLSLLDIHYLAMKHYGVIDEMTEYGRPSWNLSDGKGLFHITFGTSEKKSPYKIEGQHIRWKGGDLPFRIDFVERVPVIHGRYYYFRHTDFLTPSLDDHLILNLNFKRKCTVCEFCQFQLYSNKPNITPRQGFNLLLSRGDIIDLKNVYEIAIVTGLFGSSKLVANHIEEIIEISSSLGFQGSIFYMGYELNKPFDIKRIINKIINRKLSGFRVAYTLESFSRRKELMHGSKGKSSLTDIREKLQMMHEEGINKIEYAYIPGLDQLNDFYRGAELLQPYALPHLCVFRPWTQGQREKLVIKEYLEMGPAYLCEMRIFYEKIYSGPIQGNNLANLWAFPIDRISPRWLNNQIVGESIGRRWWRGMKDLRALDTQILDDSGGK